MIDTDRTGCVTTHTVELVSRGKLGATSRRPPDFGGRAAETGVRLDGFYQSQSVDRRFFRGRHGESEIAASFP